MFNTSITLDDNEFCFSNTDCQIDTAVYVHEVCQIDTAVYVREVCQIDTAVYVHGVCQIDTAVYVHEVGQIDTAVYIHELLKHTLWDKELYTQMNFLTHLCIFLIVSLRVIRVTDKPTWAG